ncbi:MAG: hypothetical protein HY820_15420 [Acidobacteria bacterium]|nr:hypothetical protein [Acidobacteriota bacterium]
MIPSASHPTWRQLVAGEKEVRSSNLSFNMLIFNLRLRYRKDPSPTTMAKLAGDCHAFFVKYEKMLESEANALVK